MIHEFEKPIPVVDRDGNEGYAIYVQEGGMFENDLWTVVLCDGGEIRTYAVNQLRIYANATFGIKPAKN